MARKLPQLQRALDAPALASVAYGEIASSIYFALGIIALHALGLTPVVLGIVGLLFIIVALSYAEGTASIRETGGAATFVRVAFNDFAGFLTGWVLFLDYLIVISLSALFFPHYLGLALGIHSIARHPGDVITGCVLIGVIALSRLARRTKLYTFGIVVPLLDLVTQILLVVLGFAILFSGSALTRGMSLGTSPSWHQIAFALPLAMLAYTGLETVANYAEEARRPGRDLPRSLFSAIGVVVVVYVLIALVALSAFPATHGTTALGTDWLHSPLMGVVSALQRARCALVRERACASTSGSPGRSSCSRPRRRPSPASAGSRIRSASTASFRAPSGDCTGARTCRRRQWWPQPESPSASSSERRFSRTR